MPLRVPAGRGLDGRLVLPAEVSRGTEYRCPDCDDRLDVYAGAQKRIHFHHRPAGACNAETLLHQTAKGLLVRAIVDWKLGRGARPRTQTRLSPFLASEKARARV
jgi:hypothetical protein